MVNGYMPYVTEYLSQIFLWRACLDLSSGMFGIAELFLSSPFFFKASFISPSLPSHSFILFALFFSQSCAYSFFNYTFSLLFQFVIQGHSQNHYSYRSQTGLLSGELRYLQHKVKGSMAKYWVIGPSQKCWEIGDGEKGVESDPLHQRKSIFFIT